MSKRKSILSPSKSTPFSPSRSFPSSPIKYEYFPSSYSHTVSVKRERSYDSENDQENQDPNTAPSTPKKARTITVNKELITVENEQDKYEALKAKYAELEKTVIAQSTRETEIETIKARNADLETTLATVMAKNASRKAKKAALKEALRVEKLKTENLLVEKTATDDKLTQLELLQKQVSPYTIISVMEDTLSIKKSDKALTKIKSSSDGKLKLITLGRPPVHGELKDQFDHIIPYSLVEKLAKKTIECRETIDDKMQLLINDTLSFFRHDKGICIKNSELKALGLKFTTVAGRASINFETSNDKYFLIENGYEDLIKDKTKQSQAEEMFVPFKQKFIKTVLTNLKNAIHDDNTKQIFCETLTSFMFCLFNQKTFAAFPSAGNISELEIRLYADADAALMKAYKAFEVVSAFDLNSYTNSSDLNGRIRVVANSGSKVREALKALAVLDEIFELVFRAKDLKVKISEYNTKYNVQIKLSNSNPDLKAYNSFLSIDDIRTQVFHHIAKQAFDMFGLKALEQTVLVPTKDVKGIMGYATAAGQAPSYFELKEGEKHRAEQKGVAKSKYPALVNFRPEKLDPMFLAKKSVDLIEMLKLTFSSFQTGFLTAAAEESCPVKILKAFTKLIALDYRIDHDDFYKDCITPFIENWNAELVHGLEDINLCGEGYID